MPENFYELQYAYDNKQNYISTYFKPGNGNGEKRKYHI